MSEHILFANTGSTTLAAVTGFDADYHIGLVPNDSSNSVAIANRVKLNAAMAAMHPNGSFYLANGRSWQSGLFTTGTATPILCPIIFRGRTYYFRGGPLKTGLYSGGQLLGMGDGYPQGDSNFTSTQPGGSCTRFIRTDPDSSSSGHFIRFRNAGFGMWGIQLFARPITGNIHSGTGTRTRTGIAIEGRDGNVSGTPTNCVTGKYRCGEIALTDFTNAIEILNGYYDDSDVFHTLGVHADETMWGRITAFNCNNAVYSSNAQAAWHHFQCLKLIGGEDGGSDDCAFNVVAGGSYKCDNLSIGCDDLSVVKVRDYSVNTSDYHIHVLRDHFDTTGQRITLFEYDNSGGNTAAWYYRYNINMTGHFSDEMYALGSILGFEAFGHEWDSTDLIKLNGLTHDPSGRWGAKIMLNIANLPPEVAAPFFQGGGMPIMQEDRDLISSDHLYDGMVINNLGAGQPAVGPPVGPGNLQVWRKSSGVYGWHNITTTSS